MINVHHEDESPIPGLAEAVARQKEEGGRLILYRRMWSAFVVSAGQNRIEHLSPHQSRVLAGLKHSAFTLLFGIWSISGLLAVPLVLIINSRGGVDVTARFSDSSIDPLRALPPDVHQSERDLKAAQWFYIVFLFGVAIVCYFIFSR